MQQYEDDRLQYYGRKMIPLRVLTENAMKRMRSIQKQQLNSASDTKDPNFNDWLLVELTKWFKEGFFTWVNKIPCKICKQTDLHAASQSIENGVRVEVI